MALMLMSALADFASAAGNPSELDRLREQRQIYQSARSALHARQYGKYRQLRERLHGYPLAAYLDYYELKRRLYRQPAADVSQFLQRHGNSYLGDRLRREWLLLLADNGDWKSFQNFYEPFPSSTVLSCRALEARLKSGDSSALDEVGHLWNVHRSQPRQCDDLFALWIDAGRLTEEMAWQRFSGAMAAGNRTLGNYLTRFLTGRLLQLAELQVEIGRYPHRIIRHNRFQEQSGEMQGIILYGINRYARREPLIALQAWRKYDAQQLFDDRARRETQQSLATCLLRAGHHREASELLADLPEIDSRSLAELLLVDALKQQDWEKVHNRVLALPASSKQEERWLYWRARALEQTGGQDPEYDSAEAIYVQLAMQRDFYAFLAADRLGREYYLGDTPSHVDASVILSLTHDPAVMRARELLAVGDGLNANREWLHLHRRLRTEKEHVALAKLVHQWGWHNKTILSLAAARSWDDLQMRFPLAYNEHVSAAAQRHSISPLLLYAITRQESAFAERARSPAGALGLMQLMPGTARQTARKAGIEYRKSFELLNPDKNISLGSFYITELLEKYDGNRILATAAYNAGPHRVDRWLKDTGKRLPIDVWIEAIPYRETRKYVQNVLAYSVIYGYRTGTRISLLSGTESRQFQ